MYRSQEEDCASTYLDLGSGYSDTDEVSPPSYESAQTGFEVLARIPERRRFRRSTTCSTNQPTSKQSVSCEICFKLAVQPCRTFCCEKTFCAAHLTDPPCGSVPDGPSYRAQYVRHIPGVNFDSNQGSLAYSSAGLTAPIGREDLGAAINACQLTSTSQDHLPDDMDAIQRQYNKYGQFIIGFVVSMALVSCLSAPHYSN